ncbi:hypothetical protein FACS189454_00090 [Planctomycetales bacterium]|nr:hypothetical protein FACS189454_00090 [Planctomycetales bacterium]
MKKMIVLTLAAFVCCANCFANAQEAKENEGKEIKLTKVNYISATLIPFKKELGIAFPGLLTLGTRIELAARDNDPVALIAAGLELKAAETAAGKTAANYKADDVIKRGIELAMERNEVTELKGVKSLLPDNETIAKALKVAEASKDESARATPLTLKKHAEKERQRRLTVNNYRNGYADVHINGRYYGRVDHRQSQIFYPHDDHGHIRLHYGDGMFYEAPHSHLHGYVEIH